MRDTDPNMAALSPDDRRRVESWLLTFDQGWHAGRLEEALVQLPASGHPLRLPTLLEMVKIDIDRNWRSGNKLEVEDYLRELPELGTPDTVPPDLLQAEYLARIDAGETADLAQFKQRFPRQAEQLRQLINRTVSAAAVRDSRATPAPATGKPLAKPGPLPEQFGRYKILRRLGQGGMGAVYLAHDAELQRDVALKVPHVATGSKEIVERFYREARAAARLSHPNICPIHDVGQIDGRLYLTMAYIEGNPLSAYINPDKPLPQGQAAQLVRKIALALEEAHQKGIIHRDLKPANIMINARKEPVIMDFGLARHLLSTDTRLTRSGAIVGTPAYMAPEQVSGSDAGPASDIYSLGVILYELLTGRIPFDGPALAVLGQILSSEPDAPSKHRPDLQPALEAICRKAMAKNPRERYGSMAEMARALAACGAPVGTPAGMARLPAQPLGPPKPEPAPAVSPGGAGIGGVMRRWRWLAAAGAAGLLIWLGIVIYVNTGEASVVIELNDPDAAVEVKLNGQAIDITGLGEPITVQTGPQELIVQGQDYETISRSFRLRRGGIEVVHIELKPTAVAASTAPGAENDGQGVTCQLFNGMNFERLVATRIDPTVRWSGQGAPHPGVNADGFSIRWTGWLRAPKPGRYRFTTYSDDGVRLWVGKQLVISNWRSRGIERDTTEKPIPFTAEPLPIKLEYYDDAGWGAIALRWADERGLEHQIPRGALFQSKEAALKAKAPRPPESPSKFTLSVFTKTRLEAKDPWAIWIRLNDDEPSTRPLARKGLNIDPFKTGGSDSFELRFERPLSAVRKIAVGVHGTNGWGLEQIAFQFFDGLRQSQVYRFDVDEQLRPKNRSRVFTLDPPPALDTVEWSSKGKSP